MLRYLAVLAVMLACFMGDASAVTDQEFQDLVTVVKKLKDENKMLSSVVVELQTALQTVQNSTIEERVTLLEVQVADLQENMSEIEEDVTDLDEDVNNLEDDVNFLFDGHIIQDEKLLNLETGINDLDEEVQDLEVTALKLDIRVSDLEENGGDGGNSSITELEVRVETLEGTSIDHETRINNTEGDVGDLQVKTVALDFKLNLLKENVNSSVIELRVEVEALEGTATDHEARITTTENDVEDLQVTTLALDFQLNVLNENVNSSVSELQAGVETLDETAADHETRMTSTERDVEDLQVEVLTLGFKLTELEGNVNSSVSELEAGVETLEGTASDHEARITAAENEIEDLEEGSADHETRLTVAEGNIQGLQAVDISHDTRITALEENGSGNSENETIAFSVALTTNQIIEEWDIVDFNVILLNEGNGYDNETDIFTVPPGGDGLYYFSVYLLVSDGEIASFDIELNGDYICTAYGDHSYSGEFDLAQATCSVVARLAEGDRVWVIRGDSTTNRPLAWSSYALFNGFSGFRI